MRRDFGRALLALLVCTVVGAVITGCRSTGGNDDAPDGFRIIKFMIGDAVGVINQNARTIEIVLPYGTDVAELVPTVEFVGAKIDPAPGTVVSFSEPPVKYTVFSKDGSAFSYLVTVTTEIPHTKEILSFALTGVTSFSTSITEDGEDAGVIKITVPYGTDVTNRTTAIAHSGDSINPVEGKPQDFRAPVTYEVYSMQGEKRVYTVQVTIAPNVENDITRFTLNGAEGVITGANITVTVPYNTSLASLTPVITVSGGASFSPAGPQNFSNRVTYTVTAADHTTTRNYTVTVNVSAIDAKDIIAFTIAGQEKSEINGNTILVTLPANMPKNPLTPTIAFAGDMVSPASGTAKDFTNVVKYTVTAADNSTKEYTVTVTNAAAKDITFNSVTANGASWTTETTTLTLQFSADMGAALKAEHITLTAASGTITKGALTNKGLGEYELAVSGIPGNNVLVSVAVAENAIYGFTITGGTKTAYVYKAPVEAAWDGLTADGGNMTQTTGKLTFTFDKDVGLTVDDITLSGTAAIKGTLSPTGTTRTLTISGINANNAELLVSLSKTGFAFIPASKTVKVYKQLSSDAGLSSLTVDGNTLSPAFSASTMDYTVAVGSGTIQVTATANDAGAKLVYVENNNAAVTSGTAFTSQTLNEGANTITVKVTAEDGSTTKSYKLTVTYTDYSSFVWIDGGTFKMGSPSTETGRGPDETQHSVTLTKGFSIGAYAVTQKEWQEVMGNNPSNFKGDNLPVEQVTWYDAIEYCNKRSEKEGLIPAYTITSRTPATGYPITDATVTIDWSKNGYRLPTEAEWEYAARGGNNWDNPYYVYAGSNTVDDGAWHKGNSGNTTHPVGTKKPNGLGIYDMSGNVEEWCWDWYDSSYYSTSPASNPTGASSGSSRVARGGGWATSAAYVRSASRGRYWPLDRSSYLGFRLVRSN